MVCGFMLLVCVTAGKAGNEASPPANSIIIPLPQNWLDTTPVRGAPLLVFSLNQFMYKCNECHIDFKTPTYECDKYLKMPGSLHLPFGAHRDMVFNHGLNLRCFNCHNCANLGTYINYDGSEIPGDTPVLLCRKCHGTTYRDWVAGIHGRTNGYWDASRGKQAKLDCNQCHNPHQPHFPRLVPRPSPAAARTKLSEKGSRDE
jgi:hypothetical protein